MDLVSYEQTVFKQIKISFNNLTRQSGFTGQQITFIPVNAKDGDNIVKLSGSMPWYKGESLLDFLENIKPDSFIEQPARLPVQFVIRPQQDAFHDFRGFAGKMESGSFSVGDQVAVLPSLRKSRIAAITCANQPVEKVAARESVVISLDDDIDISRGNMLIKKGEVYNEISVLQATVCWMVNEPLKPGAMCLLQHGINRVKAKITSIHAVLNIHTMEFESAEGQFELNDIGIIQLKLARPVFGDRYNDNPANGTFILIDEFNNNTVAVGFIKDF
jgi:sulfate adenylyltransferase subunit 1